MAESNATQVILTDDGLKIIKAQTTADSAASQAENANSALSIAKSTANAARSAADSTYSYANSEMAVQSNATAKAQSTAESAFSQAKTAIDNGNATSQAVTALKDGSTMTIAQLQNGLETKVANSEYASYKTQAASQIGQMVTNGAFSAYSQATANLISDKVATSDFSTYKEQTATAINSKVNNGDFNTYKSQTATAISSKVDNGDFSTYKTQTADDINLRVTKKGLIDEINLQAGNTLISSSGQLTLSGKTIYFDTDNPVIIPNANITDTLNGKTINGTTFHGGDIINDANNTSQFYPTTISSDGHIYTAMFNPVDAMQTDLSTGSLTTKYRAINSSDNRYEAYDTTIQPNQIALFAGSTNGKDMSFAQSVTGSNQDGYVLISPLDGMTLHGDNQQITFNGTSADVTPKGIIITPYGNINPNGTQNVWYVGNNMSMKTASFGMDAGQNFGISLSRQTLVDEIGAMGNRLPNGRLFLHAVDNDAQMYLLNDGSPAFVSPTIYNRTYSNGANMFVTSSGRVGRSTSASKYKLAIARSDDTSQADRLMTLNPASWNDKVATEKMAESLSNGEIPVEPEINLKRHYGLIAEDLRDAGLDEFLITGNDGQIEGIEYDRLWTVLIPKIKQLNNRINELERKTL